MKKDDPCIFRQHMLKLIHENPDIAYIKPLIDEINYLDDKLRTVWSVFYIIKEQMKKPNKEFFHLKKINDDPTDESILNFSDTCWDALTTIDTEMEQIVFHVQVSEMMNKRNELVKYSIGLPEDYLKMWFTIDDLVEDYAGEYNGEWKREHGIMFDDWYNLRYAIIEYILEDGKH